MNIKTGMKQLLCAMAVAGLSLGMAHAAEQVKVDVISLVEHPALDATADGVHDALEKADYVEGENLKWKFQTAQNNNAIAAQIARTFVGEKPNVIVAIATPAAQAVVAATKDIPVVYSTVTDPVAADLVPTWEPSGTNVTGMSDALPLEDQIELLQKISPDAKVVGMVYNPGEANSVAVAKELKQLLPEYGMELKEANAPRTVDVGSAARSLVGKVDVFYTNTDNNVVSAFEAIAKVADDAKIPLLASDTASVERGAIAALGVDYYQLGYEAGEKVVRILEGEKPGDIASDTSSRFELHVSPSNAEKQGVQLPQDVLDAATKILD